MVGESGGQFGGGRRSWSAGARTGDCGRREVLEQVREFAGCFQGQEVAAAGDDGQGCLGQVGQEVAAQCRGRLDLVVLVCCDQDGNVDAAGRAGDVLGDAVRRPFETGFVGAGPGIGRDLGFCLIAERGGGEDGVAGVRCRLVGVVGVRQRFPLRRGDFGSGFRRGWSDQGQSGESGRTCGRGQLRDFAAHGVPDQDVAGQARVGEHRARVARRLFQRVRAGQFAGTSPSAQVDGHGGVSGQPVEYGLPGSGRAAPIVKKY